MPSRRQFLYKAGPALILTGIAGCAENSDSNETPDDGESNDGDNAESNDGESNDGDNAEPVNHNFGEAFTVGNGDKSLQYTIQPPDNLYQSIGVEDANGIFLILNMSIKNVGNESVNLTTNSFSLVNENAQTYEVDTTGTIYLDRPISFEQINPNVTAEGQIAFDIPETGSHRYNLVIDPAGTFSTASSHTVGPISVDL